ncbi:MAG: hypothetical protein QW478_00495 [Candidatus Micrarchaeaceae archaeon]
MYEEQQNIDKLISWITCEFSNYVTLDGLELFVYQIGRYRIGLSDFSSVSVKNSIFNVLKNFILEIYDDEIIPPDVVPSIKLNICQYYFSKTNDKDYLCIFKYKDENGNVNEYKILINQGDYTTYNPELMSKIKLQTERIMNKYEQMNEFRSKDFYGLKSLVNLIVSRTHSHFRFNCDINILCAMM